MPAVSFHSQILCRLLKCPPEQFQGIAQGAGGAFFRLEDGSSQDLADCVDSIRRVSRQVRPCPHPSDEYPALFGPCPVEPGSRAFQLGPEDCQPMYFGRLDGYEVLRQAGEHPAVLEDGAEEELVVGCGNPGIELLLGPGLWIPVQFPAAGPYSWVRDIRLPEQVQRFPELPLGRFGRHGPKAELSGHECGGGIVEADRGPGVVLEGEAYGLDGGVEGMIGDRRAREGLLLEAVGSLALKNG
jgi:hypothetical protein